MRHMDWSQKTLEVIHALDLDIPGDKIATQALDKIIKSESPKHLEDLIRDRPALILGCGPSLENDLNKIFKSSLQKKCVIVAVDGAVEPILMYNIVPHLVVTDLDADPRHLILASRHGSMILVHAHHKNQEAIQSIVPKLSGRVYGTTHSKSTLKVRNYGGFKDGDRAAYILEKFHPKMIILAGMDFGHIIGKYSGTHDNLKKPRALRVGKGLIEDLAKSSKTPFFNLTHGGEHIMNTRPITVEKLRQIL
jgi:2-amino-4-hydroxy-6-hydroxymethyldihydropteridine diphosphokinase